MKHMTMHYARSEAAIKSSVRSAVMSRGIPTDIAAARDLASALYPSVMDQRAYLAAREGELILDEFSDLSPAKRRFYPLSAVEEATLNAAGINPDNPEVLIEHLDPTTQKLARVKSHPYLDPDNPEALTRFIDDLTASASRHVKSASRDLVADTARLNKAGWARQLSGAENCSFCAMLVSRGAVYSKKSVNFQTHNHCDCTATIVKNKGDNYPGKDAAIRLNDMYRASGNNLTKFRQLLNEEVGESLESLAA